MNSILENFALKHTPFLHGGGRKATLLLMESLELEGSERVLECGFGTGASLVTLKAAYPELDLQGIEVSSKMLSVARKRLTWAGLNDIQLYTYAEDRSFPFQSGSFDRVYAESVFGILPILEIESILGEILRILKPGGRLIINETIWLENVYAKEIAAINGYCLEQYGIVQAQSDLPYVNHWLDFFRDKGFIPQGTHRIEETAAGGFWRLPEFRSFLFSMTGRLASILDFKKGLKILSPGKRAIPIFEKGRQYLECYILAFQKAHNH